MATPSASGIYEIVNTVSGKRYIGSAENLRIRWRTHQWALRKGRHHSYRLQAAWNKHGAAAFEFRVLEYCPDMAALLDREQHYIDTLRPVYNVAQYARGGGGVMSADGRERVAESNRRRKGWKMSAESRALMSLTKLGNTATKGKPRNQDAVAKTAAAHRGMKRSEETRAKIAAKARERKMPPRSEEYRAKVSARFKGRVLTPEHFAAWQAGRAKRVFTDEQRAAVSVFMTGRPRPKSPEHRAKIAAALRGRKATPEARANQAAAQRGKKRGPYKRRQPIQDAQGVLAL